MDLEIYKDTIPVRAAEKKKTSPHVHFFIPVPPRIPEDGQGDRTCGIKSALEKRRTPRLRETADVISHVLI
jgi:hypothetical protein